MPLIAKFYGKGRAVGERSSVIGTMGEIIVGLKSGVTLTLKTYSSSS